MFTPVIKKSVSNFKKLLELSISGIGAVTLS